MFIIVDIVITVVIFLSTLISWIRGFTREILSLLAWIGAFWVGFSFSHPVADIFTNYIKAPSLRIAVAFTLLFIVTFILISILNFCIGLLINRVGLSSLDKFFGVFVGAARGILLVALMLLLAKLTPVTEDAWWKNSLLIPKFEPIENWLKSFMPEYVEKHTIATE